MYATIVSVSPTY